MTKEKLKENWYKFWNEESQNTEQKWLTPDTHGIITDFFYSNLQEIRGEDKKKIIDFLDSRAEEVDWYDKTRLTIKEWDKVKLDLIKQD